MGPSHSQRKWDDLLMLLHFSKPHRQYFTLITLHRTWCCNEKVRARSYNWHKTPVVGFAYILHNVLICFTLMNEFVWLCPAVGLFDSLIIVDCTPACLSLSCGHQSPGASPQQAHHTSQGNKPRVTDNKPALQDDTQDCVDEAGLRSHFKFQIDI